MDEKIQNPEGHNNEEKKQEGSNRESQANSGAKILYMTGRPELDDQLNWNTLRYVQRIAEHGSFLDASEYLGRSQAHLSIKVAALEKTLGYALFHRSDRGVTLTRKGQELLSVVTPFLHDLRGVTRAGAREDGIRTIRIVTTHAVMSYILLEPLMQYQMQHPEVRFDLVGDDVNLDLVRHDADIVIRPPMDIAPGITQIPLFTLVKKLYASQSYLDRYGEPKTVEELDHHALISRVDHKLSPHSDIDWILKVGAPLGKKRQAKYVANQTESLIDYASRGFGIVGAYPMMKHVRNAPLINLLPNVSSTPTLWTLCTSESSTNDEEVERLKMHLLEAFKC